MHKDLLRAIAALLLGLSVIALAGCGGGGDEEEEPPRRPGVDCEARPEICI